MNQLSLQVIEATIGKKSPEIEKALSDQMIFNPDEAVKIGLIQEIKPDFSTPGAVIADMRLPNNDQNSGHAPIASVPSFKSSETAPAKDTSFLTSTPAK
jgi:hypothetical protein